jgi:hypothetical protein
VRRDDKHTPVIWVKREEEYFYRWGWTGRIKLIPRENFFFARDANEAPAFRDLRLAARREP